MKKLISIAAVALLATGVAACDSAAENQMEQNAEAVEDTAEVEADMMRDNADGTAMEETVDAQADAVEASGEAEADAMEDAADNMDPQ